MIERVVVLWPGARAPQEVVGLSINGVYRITQGRDLAERIDLPRIRLAGTPGDASQDR